MKALAVTPGRPDSLRLIEVRKPSLDEVAGSRGVLVQVFCEVGNALP